MNSAVDKYRGMSIGAANFLDVPDMECFKRESIWEILPERVYNVYV